MEKVIVLLSTYNGGAYLVEQLYSLSAQCDVDVEIIVRDDGSTDETVNILNEWQSRGALRWYSGENLGSAGSFMDLLYNAPDADYYAFCDQDDVWFPDKLQRAVRMLKEDGNENAPTLYFSAQTLVDSDKNIIGYNIPERLFTFGESILRNPASGCTMVFGRDFRNLIVRERPDYVYMHDMWLYMVCLSVGGALLFDPVPSMLYRQHSKNVVGCNQSFFQKMLRRFRMFLDGKDSIRMKTCEQLLKCYSKDMPERHVDILNSIMQYRSSIKNKLKLLRFKEINTTSCFARCFFCISVFANRY
jgi:rhamnosyltransferase